MNKKISNQSENDKKYTHLDNIIMYCINVINGHRKFDEDEYNVYRTYMKNMCSASKFLYNETEKLMFFSFVKNINSYVIQIPYFEHGKSAYIKEIDNGAFIACAKYPDMLHCDWLVSIIKRQKTDKIVNINEIRDYACRVFSFSLSPIGYKNEETLTKEIRKSKLLPHELETCAIDNVLSYVTLEQLVER